MHCPAPVAVRRTDRQPLFRGWGRRARCGPCSRLLGAGPAAPRASARERCRVVRAPGFGRWGALLRASLRRRAAPGRRWYRPARVPLPGVAGPAGRGTLLGRARRARGFTTPGDARLETRVDALERYVFRLGHAARSGRFATSVAQLVVGLAPVMGWGTVPRGRVVRARFVRAHRRSVQRWLDDLQRAGVVAHERERDQRGQWWRTQIVLLAAPEPSREELGVARVRGRGSKRRERARRRAGRVAPSLAAIRGRSGVPGGVMQRRVARTRAAVAHEARRRAAVDAQITLAGELRSGRGLLTHRFGAPPASAEISVSARRSGRSATPGSGAPGAARPAEPLVESGPLVVARTRARLPPGRHIVRDASVRSARSRAQGAPQLHRAAASTRGRPSNRHG
jgi:hypothetical protein